MKKILLFSIFVLGMSSFSFAQSAGGSGSEKVKSGGRAHRSSKSGAVKPRKQMRHFSARKADPNIKNNGTSYRMQKRREQYEAENNGFSSGKRK